MASEEILLETSEESPKPSASCWKGKLGLGLSIITGPMLLLTYLLNPG